MRGTSSRGARPVGVLHGLLRFLAGNPDGDSAARAMAMGALSPVGVIAALISESVASARHMIAMKIRAARGERDLEDISLLSEQLGIRSISAVLALADDVWGPGMVRAECTFLVAEGPRDRGFAD